MTRPFLPKEARWLEVGDEVQNYGGWKRTVARLQRIDGDANTHPRVLVVFTDGTDDSYAPTYPILIRRRLV
jgi:hypothetical protein